MAAPSPALPPARASRSIEAVLFPARFAAFPGVTTPAELAAAWQRSEAWVLANHAHAAYCGAAVITDTLGRLGARAPHFYERDSAFGFLAEWPEHVVLAFRGTEPTDAHPIPPALRQLVERLLERVLRREIQLPESVATLVSRDVLADLRFAKVALGAARVHGGFLGELRKLWNEVAADLARLRAAGDPRPLLVTGHSLGGAMATLAAAHFPFARVVTFGEPRSGIGLDAVLRVAAEDHIRYVNGLDPVPELPPAFWPFGFEHHGTLRRLAPPTGRDLRFDHSILDYVDRL